MTQLAKAFDELLRVPSSQKPGKPIELKQQQARAVDVAIALALPTGRAGRDHHAELDLAAASIELGSLTRAKEHKVNQEFVDYHNNVICKDALAEASANICDDD